MGIYNFRARFVPFILDVRKTHTIRSIRANPDKPGNTLHLYTGLRTKKAKLLMRVPCVRVEEICIHETIRTEGVTEYRSCLITIDGDQLSDSEMEALARRDGFRDFPEMLAFWNERHQLPFRGHIIHWRKS